MAKFLGSFAYHNIGGDSFEVIAKPRTGKPSAVGVAENKYFPHIRLSGWEAHARDGSRGVHPTREKAAMALVWDGESYLTFIHPAEADAA